MAERKRAGGSKPTKGGSGSKASKKSTAKRSTAQKSTAQKSTAKKSTAKKSTGAAKKPASAGKSAGDERGTKKPPAKKPTSKKPPAKKTPAKKPAAKRSTAGDSSEKKSARAEQAVTEPATAERPAAEPATVERPAPKATAGGRAAEAPAHVAKAPPRRSGAKGPARVEEDPATEAPLPPLEQSRQWIGDRIDGMGGRTLGRVAGIHVDAEDGRPRWLTIRRGPLAGCTAIPYGDAAPGAGRLWAAYERGRLRDAPRVKPGDPLTAGQEVELCDHWGIREGKGRSAEVEELDEDAVTAVPVED